MYELNAAYINLLEELAVQIQESQELAAYQDSEEEEDYIAFKNAFEPQIAGIYHQVAHQSPLQLVALEQVLMDTVFEGLFLPKMLGYVVLRGTINKEYKYLRPQEHFRELVLAISASPNFELLRKRIGMSVQVGFSLCSDIWITNLLEVIENRKVRAFFQQQKNEKFIQLSERRTAYQRFSRQFQHEVFLSAEFPTNNQELVVLFPHLKRFLLSRVEKSLPNESLYQPLSVFVAEKSFQGTPEYEEILLLYGLFFDMPESDRIALHKILEKVSSAQSEVFVRRAFGLFLDYFREVGHWLSPQADARLSGILDKSRKDDLSDYYRLVDRIHKDGITEEAVQEVILEFHAQHDGLSDVNECVRLTISRYLTNHIGQLSEADYPEFFAIFTRLFPVYRRIFNNEYFNLRIREEAMAYLNKLLEHFTDKRGRDYQDIKRFVGHTFVELKLLTSKEVLERFKTPRKKD